MDNFPSDSLDESEFEAWLAAHENGVGLRPIESTGQSATPIEVNASSSKKSRSHEQRGSTNSFQAVQSVDIQNEKLRPGNAVETRDGDFLIISAIVRHVPTHEIYLRGQKFRRNRRMMNQMPKQTNEVCWIQKSLEIDLRDTTTHSIKQVPLAEVLRRRNIHKTNRPFPAMSFRSSLNYSSQWAGASFEGRKMLNEVFRREGDLVCRWKFLAVYANENDLRHDKSAEQSFAELDDLDCDEYADAFVPPEVLRYEARDFTSIGGACDSWLQGEKEFLRQEEECNNGETRFCPLEAKHHKWPIGDPMERGFVGSLYDEDDIDESDTETLAEGLKGHRITPSQEASGSRRRRYMEFKARMTAKTPISTSTNQYSGKFTSSSQLETRGRKTRQYQVSASKRKARSKSLGFSSEDSDLICLSESNQGSPLSADNTKAHIYDLTNPAQPSFNDCLALVSPRGAPGSITSFHNMSNQHKPEIVDLTQRSPVSPILGEITNSSKPTKRQPESLYDYIAREISESPRKKRRARAPFHIPKPRYTFGDAFCGGGGMSRGASMAGLRNLWAFDIDVPSCETYLMNNFGTRVYNLWADQFVKLPKHYDLQVDILHLSPPCQFFSGAHTQAGKDDERNTATQFALDLLIKRCKPRIVTMEQTAGLALQRKHRPYFDAVINTFTSNRYNIRWRVLQCADYGVPSRRHRLFIIASCQGETLPTFPKPTHQQHYHIPGVKTWNTINNAVKDIPDDWPNHDVEEAVERNERRYSGDRVANCILTANSMIHPSGKRDFTDRERACLSSFPLCHKFGNFVTRDVRKQIGNAVPPLMASILLQHIKKWLMKVDGITADQS